MIDIHLIMEDISGIDILQRCKDTQKLPQKCNINNNIWLIIIKESNTSFI